VTAQIEVLFLIAVAGCASGRPAPRQALQDLPPLPRTSIVAALSHRSDLQLTDEKAAALEQADAELQQRLVRLHAGVGGGRHGGGGREREEQGPPTGARRRNPEAVQEALDASLDDAGTAAFLGAEQQLAPAQREQAQEIANRYREQLFERRELIRGRRGFPHPVGSGLAGPGRPIGP
jgi:hypothetical protein